MASTSQRSGSAAPAMPAVETVLNRMAGYGARPAIDAGGRELSYTAFLELVSDWNVRLHEHGIGEGSVVAVLGEFSPQTCALFFALIRARAIAVPFTKAVHAELDRFMEIAGVEYSIVVDAGDAATVRAVDGFRRNALIEAFLAERMPGLVVFTSGSTGEPKGILHNLENVMKKFVTERPGWRSILFLLMDHFGGFNTFLGAFAYGGAAVCVADRSPEAVCEAIQRGRATLLPTTPTFINLLIASNVYRSYDLSSVRMITYGTEVMPEATLAKVHRIFPNAQIKQTYGLSELGVLRSKSESDASLWVKIGGDGFEVKIVDDVLWVRSEANMVGYLNAPSPFDGEGWMCTGDHVETKGDYMRIAGRKSDLINVGGQKVFPAEVETVLLEAPNVREATVYGGPHPIMGQVVLARISLAEPEPAESVTERLRAHCVKRLQKFKVPVRFTVVAEGAQHSDRFKKVRRGIEDEPRENS
jgi:acyl-CoA synthetase (AMP-forming)/AMP-acid ligase II